jgi:hypothetical protein
LFSFGPNDPKALPPTLNVILRSNLSEPFFKLFISGLEGVKKKVYIMPRVEGFFP